LFADANKTNALRSKLCDNSSKKIYGLSWHSKGKKYFNRKKNINLELLLRAFDSDRHCLLSLQYGNTTEAINKARKLHHTEFKVLDDIDVTHDIDGLASLICACDEIVTISNTTAHLAGALGKRTHLLLASSPHWYWGAHDSSTVWYSSVSIYRQTHRGNWSGVIDGLKNSLRH
jgi:ADP-heptose:LPS heptosyltransferase